MGLSHILTGNASRELRFSGAVPLDFRNVKRQGGTRQSEAFWGRKRGSVCCLIL